MPIYPGVIASEAASAPSGATFGKDGSPQFSTFTTTTTVHDHTHIFGVGCNAFTMMFGGEVRLELSVTSVVIDPAGANIACSSLVARTQSFARIWSYEAHGLSSLSGSKTVRITWANGDASDRGRVQSQSYLNAANSAPSPTGSRDGTSGASISIPLLPLSSSGIVQFGVTINTNQAVEPINGLTETAEYQDATTGFTTWYGEKVGSLSLGSPSEAPGASWSSSNRIAAIAFVVNPTGVNFGSWAYPLQTDFTDHGAILTGSGWDAAQWNTIGNCVVANGSTCHLYYEGGDVWQTEHAEHSKLGVLTSSDGVSWTDYSGNPIASYNPLANGGINAVEEGYWMHGVHRRENGTWTCVFGGQQGVGATTVQIDIFLQTSNDGLAWTPNTASGATKIVDDAAAGWSHTGANGDEIGATGLWYDEANALWHVVYVAKTQATQWEVHHVQGSSLTSLAGANSNKLLARSANPYEANGFLRAGPIVDRGNGIVDVLVLAMDSATGTEPGVLTTIARIPILPDYSWTAPGPPQILYYFSEDFSISTVTHTTCGFFPAVSKALIPYIVTSNQDLKIRSASAVQTSDGHLSYSPVGARFTASGTQYLSRAALTGQANSGKCTVAFAIKLAAATPIASAGVIWRVEVGTSYRFHVQVNTTGTLTFLARNSSATTILDLTTTAGVNNDKWYTVVASIDMAAYANCHVYIDRVSRKPGSAATFTAAGTIGFGGVDSCTVGRQSGGVPQYLDAEIADLGFIEGVAFDLSDSRVLNRFVTTNNELQNPAVDGRRMFLTRAIAFFTGNGANFPTNRGTGGAFTTNSGPLTNSGTNPSGHP